MSKIHNFTEQSTEEYRRTIFCTKCGQVAWNYNWGEATNIKLQASIKECVEQEESKP